MARPGVLCLLAALAGAGRAGATDLAGSKAAAPQPWTLAVALFARVDPAALAETAAPDFSFEAASAMAAAASREALSAALPNLLRQALSPLPDRRDAKAPARPVSLFDVSAASGGPAAAPFADLARQAASAGGNDAAAGGKAEAGEKTWNGLVAGFYSLSGEAVDCRVLLFEAGAAAPSRSLSWRGDIGALDLFAGALLPSIASWIAGSDLGVVDFLPMPESGAPLSLTMETSGQAGKMAGTVKGSRLFIAAPGDCNIRVERSGYAPRTVRISGGRLGSYRRETVALEAAAAPAAAASLAGASSILTWSERDDFNRFEKRYRSALGRFVASVPLTAIVLGVFFSYSEARARGAASDAAYYASGAGAAAAAGLSLGFAIDCAAGLADLLRVSK